MTGCERQINKAGPSTLTDVEPSYTSLVQATSTIGSASTSSSTSSSLTRHPNKSDRPVLYIVLDDVGHNMSDTARFLDLPIALTFAILPDLKYTQILAQLIAQTKHGVILHQPMQPVSKQNPGPGVIKRGMSKEEVERILEKNSAQLGAIQAINNHMGSLGTSDPKLMSYVFGFLKKKNWAFLDSRTSTKTVARIISKEFGVPLIERDIFLDNLEQEEAIRAALQRGLIKARQQGYAVMIGHVWSDDLVKVLFDVYPQILEEGFDFDTIASWFLGAKGLSPGNPEAPIFFETGNNGDDSSRY